MSRILITGATGFLGGALVKRLHSDGFDIVATGRNKRMLESLPLPNKNKIEIDLATTSPTDLLAKFGDIERIIHCAALSSPWGGKIAFWSANVRATENCLTLANALNIEHFVHISSPAVYFQFQDQLNVAEHFTLPKPVNHYARTKAIAESRVKANGLAYTIIRPRGIYGPGDTALLPRLLRAAETGPLPRFQNGSVKTDITYIDDVLDAISCTLNSQRQAINKTFNISGGVALPICQIAERACAAKNIKVRWRNLPIGPTLAAVRINEFISKMRSGKPEPRITAYGLGVFAYSQTLDISNAQKHLGWQPKISLEEGLERTFYRQHGRQV